MAMSEEMIERAVEQKFDSLDRRLMNGSITQAEYDIEARGISVWANLQYANLATDDRDYDWTNG